MEARAFNAPTPAQVTRQVYISFLTIIQLLLAYAQPRGCLGSLALHGLVVIISVHVDQNFPPSLSPCI